MKKIMTISSLAVVTTFALFSFMAFLIKSDQVNPIDTGATSVIEVYQTPKDSEVKSIIRKPLQPPVPPKPMPSMNLAPETTTASGHIGYQPAGLEISVPETEVGGMGGYRDTEARPVVRVNPKYPIEAARNGIEGWVILAFDISAIGEVVNIKILDSEPKRVFDKAAKQALRKWKYRAKSVDGRPVSQENFTVQLDFNMDQPS